MSARLSKDQRNQAVGMFRARSTVNNIARHFGCSRQTIHNLVNRNNITGSVRDRATCDNVTYLLRFHVNLHVPTLSFLPATIIGRRLRGSCTDDH